MAIPWTVLRHGQIEKLQGEVYSVEGSLPSGPIPRWMIVVRGAGGGLTLHNPVALDEAGMKALDALGPVETIVVPSGMHRIDGPRFAERYPKAKVVTPRGARGRVAKVMRVDATYDAVGESIGGIAFEHLDGTKEREGVLRVQTPEGALLIFNDAVMNLPPKLPGFVGWMFGALGSLGAPKVTRIYRTAVLSNKKALAEHFTRLAAVPDVRRIVPGHGSVIDADVPGVLRSLAASL